jgi:hypothetical protein
VVNLRLTILFAALLTADVVASPAAAMQVSASRASGDNTRVKDPVIIETPRGGRVEIRIPHDDITVRKISDKVYEVKINPGAGRGTEVKVLPKK